MNSNIVIAPKIIKCPYCQLEYDIEKLLLADKQREWYLYQGGAILFDCIGLYSPDEDLLSRTGCNRQFVVNSHVVCTLQVLSLTNEEIQ